MTTDLDVRRSTIATDPDGVEYRILAAKRGVPLREQVLDGTGAADSIGGFVMGLILGLVITTVLEVGAAGRSTWKLGVVRLAGFPQRIRHKEVLPSGADPDERMSEISALISSGGWL